MDNVVEFGPENFTHRTLTPGRYKIAVNAYSLDFNEARNAVITVSFNQGGNAVTRTFGPYRFSQSGHNYPVGGNTANWWRPLDIVVDASGNVTLADPDLNPISRGRGVILTK